MIRAATHVGTFLPTWEQYELLRATLLPDRTAVAESLRRWKATVRFDDIEIGALRMMPLLYRNLHRLGIDDELLPRLKGIYRQVWFRNQLILHQGMRALRALREERVPALVIAGGALIATVYDEAALRPMDDFDLVVRRQDFRRAVAAIMRSGWHLHPEAPDPEPHLEFHHAVALRSEGPGEIDLHWASMYGHFDRRGEDEFWRGSREASLAGEQVMVLSHEDQLIQLCAHATLRNTDIAPIRWVADALLLIEKSGRAFDWTRVVEIARLRRLSLTMVRTLAYLRGGFDAPVPAQVIDSLRDNVRAGQSVALRFRMAGRSVQRWYVAWVWIRLLFIDGPAAVPRRFALLRRYVRSSFRLPPETSLVRFVFGKALRPPVASASSNRDTTRS